MKLTFFPEMRKQPDRSLAGARAAQMDREKLQTFIRAAAADLSSVRSSLLIVAQAGDASDLAVARRNLSRIKTQASENGFPTVVDTVTDCESALNKLEQFETVSPNAAHAALDAVARIEAALWDAPLHSDDFLVDVGAFVDASFDGLTPQANEQDGWVEEQFEIDEETLDIFRIEADELLSNIGGGLRTLSRMPGDQNALWDIRRNAHTFKGAAGIVGLKSASEIAHQMEDLLDRVVEMRLGAAPEIVELLDVSAGRLGAIVAAKSLDEDDGVLTTRYADLMDRLSPAGKTAARRSTGAIPAAPVAQTQVEAAKSNTTPVVRVSLDRLDELIELSRSLITNRTLIGKRFARFNNGSDDRVRLESLLENGRQLAEDVQAKLLRIRMIKFGTLETRLGRAVNVTCQDENKKAAIEIENGHVEIDTQVIDTLIEPLLHLLKNAVVHGIEPPDTRRLIGKPEKGTIRIGIEADDDAVILTVSDDGGGISVHKLKEKAIAGGLLDADSARSMSDRDAIELIFDRGLTTADKIDLNAGRGVGMSIVKESVESRGGTVMVESEPQRGTTFTILMPIVVAKPQPEIPSIIASASGATGTPSRLVLIIDDSASIRLQTTRLVEGAGFRVLTASDGAEGLELLLAGGCEPSLILSDVEMPQMDGWQFLENVKTNENFVHIPIVMVTSLSADEHRHRATSLGASGYITKPLNEKSLEKTLENLGLSVAI